MPFKKKKTIQVGKSPRVDIPRPPTHATHARLILDSEFKENGDPKTATLPIRDFDCFYGVSGEFSYIRMDNRRKLKEEYSGTWTWNGRSVEGIEGLLEGE
tara:strand:+ start:726 stop:1025 length:300 start_codon:yes stop_codon:yes gene_type:complete